jgi:phage-related protein
MTTQKIAIRDIYTRKVGGETYEYEAQYSSGENVTWNARVYRDGVLKGSTGGMETGNHLEGEALRESIVTLVEVAIEGMQGIGE